MEKHTSENRKHLLWSYFSTTSTNALRLVLGMISGVIVSRLLMPGGRGELAILLYFPTLMGALLSLGTPQAITALISKCTRNTEEVLTAGFRLAVIQILFAVPLFIIIAPRTLTGDNRHLGSQVATSCACGAFMILAPYLNAMAYGLKRFTWVNIVTLVNQGGYAISLIFLWLIGTLTPFHAALCCFFWQFLQCALHLIHIKPSWLNAKAQRQAYIDCIRLGMRFAAPSLAIVLLANADRAILIRMTTLVQIGYFAVAYAVTTPITFSTEAFTQIGFVEISSSGNPEVSFSLMMRRFQMSQVVAGAGFVSCALLIDPAIRYGFGKAFVGAISAAYPLALTMAFRAMTRTLENSLRGMQFVVPGTVGAAINLGALIVLSVLMVPQWGAFGFSCASLLSECIYLSCLAGYLKSQRRIPLNSLWGIRPSILRAMLLAGMELLRHRSPAKIRENAVESRC